MSVLGGSANGDTRRAVVLEPPDAKSVTSSPAATRPSASSETTDSTPPYAGGGTGNHGGASTPILTTAPRFPPDRLRHGRPTCDRTRAARAARTLRGVPAGPRR